MNKKKIVQVNTVYGSGSTGKITASLYNGALNCGFETYVAYGRGNTPSQNGINGILVGNKIDFATHVLSNFLKGNSGFASKGVTKKFLRFLDEVKPDLLHFHNLHGFYLNMDLLFDYVKKHDIPVVWTFHDCWPFTGQCAYFDFANCDKWKSECHDCPIYRTDYPYSLFKDNSKNNFYNKQKAFTGVNKLTIVTPSKWLEGLVNRSFLKEYDTITISNGINTDIFKPIVDNEEISNVLVDFDNQYKDYGIKDKKIILGVANIWDARKGLDYFLRLSEYLNETNGYLIVLVGVSKEQQKMIMNKFGKQILPITRTNNQIELAKWYLISHVYVNPTLQDNYPTTNLEAQACGTPVVTFNTGGSPETLVIDSLPNKVVEKGNFDALLEAIKEIDAYDIPDVMELKKLSNEEFVPKYMELYEKMLS